MILYYYAKVIYFLNNNIYLYQSHINLLVDEIIKINHVGNIDHDIDLIVRLPDGPVYVYSDRIQIQQVLMNLLSNAIFAARESSTGESKIVISGIVESGNITISVRDFGPGIDPEIIGKVFKPFVTSKKDGLGIGLAISRTIIEDHHGNIQAENMPDGGAKFSFSLKIYDDGA